VAWGECANIICSWEGRPMKSLFSYPNMTKRALIYLLIAVWVVTAGPRRASASEEAHTRTGSRFLVLNDNDYDGPKAAPARDTVDMVDSHGEYIRTVADGLNVTGPCSLSISEDGRLFAVCDRGEDVLAVYEVATGRKVWSLLGVFDSAVFSNGSIYASSADSIYTINGEGVITKHARMITFDSTVDRRRNSLWISGLGIRKWNLDLEPVLTVKHINGLKGPWSIESNPDGSIWLAQQDGCGRSYTGNNQLMKVSPEGRVLRAVSIELCSSCVCADEFSAGVWVTGKIEGRRDFSRISDQWPETLTELDALTKTPVEAVTQRFDSEGRLILNIPDGGDSLVVDPVDGSVWIMMDTGISHFSFEGKKLSIPADLATGRRWLALVPTG
jgi:hypothetical protein